MLCSVKTFFRVGYPGWVIKTQAKWIDCEQSLSFHSVFLAFLRASVELWSSERRDAYLRASVELSSSERRVAFLRASVELSSSERRDTYLRASVELSSSDRRDAFLRASVSFSNLHNFN